MATNPLEIFFWDVQHGNAIYIRTPNGLNIVIDLGVGSYGGEATFSPLLHLKRMYYVQQLDCVIITHPHKDHIDDIMNFYTLSPRSFACPRELLRQDIMPGVRPDDRYLFEQYFKISDAYPPPAPLAGNCLMSQNNGGVDFKLFPSPLCDKANINNHSVVTVISYANSKIIIPGDNEPPSWTELLRNEAFVAAITKADVLLAPHHGRNSGFCADIFQHFNPYITIISDGAACDNSATDRYSKVSRGWQVRHRDTRPEEVRKCLTTRSDGVIVARFGYNTNGTPFMGFVAN